MEMREFQSPVAEQLVHELDQFCTSSGSGSDPTIY